ncbi:MAG: hypothetical protein K9J13_05120 [Saprospiraceae bacterium]|nr:hypothetical protein [Saprospiraceae bacterium]
MKKLSITIIALLITVLSFAQDTIFKQDVSSTCKISNRGPNRQNFYHFYMGYGFILGEADGAGSEINQGSSGSFDMGVRYKLKICNHYAIGYQINYNTDTYVIKQNGSKTFTDTIQHDKERFATQNLGIGVYNRFNFGRRGNYVGNFLDIGAYADWRFSAQHFMKDELPNGNIVRTSVNGLNFMNDGNYGAYAQIGYNRYVLYAKYRLSDMFNNSVQYSELPRLTVGFQIGFHK